VLFYAFVQPGAFDLIQPEELQLSATSRALFVVFAPTKTDNLSSRYRARRWTRIRFPSRTMKNSLT